MGDPKKTKKKYSKPRHPWEKGRIEQEKILLKEYGLKNKKEIWKAQSILRRSTFQAKRLTSLKTEQSKKEKEQLINKLFRLDLIKKTANLDDVLGLELKNILDRRLQTRIFKQGLSRTIDQARQFIVHGHIFVGDKKITVPSYIVKNDEESKITFDPKSKLSNLDHPERPKPIETKKEVKKELKKKPREKTEKKEVKKEKTKDKEIKNE